MPKATRKCIVHSNLKERPCPICGDSRCFEPACVMSEKRMGRMFDHKLSEHIGICGKCGFIFANPTLSQEEFNEYYNDSLTYYNATDTYSVSARIALISKYLKQGNKVGEIGGNEQGEFCQKIKSICEEYFSFDINKSAVNTQTDAFDMPVVDMLLSYCTLEHIVNLDAFILNWSESLVNGGVFVIEVPDATLYGRDVCSLRLTEHVNHFTPDSLTMLMEKYGYSVVEISRYYRSRDFCFVGVFKKEFSKKKDVFASRFLLNDGIMLINEQDSNKKNTVRKIYDITRCGGVGTLLVRKQYPSGDLRNIHRHVCFV